VNVGHLEAGIEPSLLHVEPHIPCSRGWAIGCLPCPTGRVDIERPIQREQASRPHRRNRLVQTDRQGLQKIVIHAKAIGRQTFKRHMPATIRRETAGSRCRHRRAVMGGTHVAKRQHTVMPMKTATKFLEAVRKP
jgi:hypothetical protein